MIANKGSSEDDPKVDAADGEFDVEQAGLNTVILERDELQDNLDALRIELSDAKSKLSTTQADLATAQGALDTANNGLHDANSELFGVRLDLNAREAVSNAFDAKVTTTLERRETFWREKVEALEKEKDIMGKALMRQWGREECGPPTIVDGVEYQPFRYKYAGKGDMTQILLKKDKGETENKENKKKDEEIQPKIPLRPRATASAKAEARARMRARKLAESVLGSSPRRV